MLRSTLSLAFCISLTIVSSSEAQDLVYQQIYEPPRKALIIGVQNYNYAGKVPSAMLDAKKFGKTIGALKPAFEVTYSLDETADQIEQKLKTFSKSLSDDDIAIIYFSGHGFQFQGLNFLAAKDTPKPIPRGKLTKQAVPLNRIIELMEYGGPGYALIVLDACRDNSVKVIDHDGTLKGGEGLASPQKSPRVMIGFAAAFGQVAKSSKFEDQNSLYTKHLIANFPSPGMESYKILRQTGLDVEDEWAEQHPWLHSSNAGDFYPNPTDEVHEIARKSWLSALADGSRKAIKRFRDNWPASLHSRAARLWLNADMLRTATDDGIISVERTSRILFRSDRDISGDNQLTHYTSLELIEKRNNKVEFYPTNSKPLSGPDSTNARAIKEIQVFDAPIRDANQIGLIPAGKFIDLETVPSWHPTDRPWLKVEVPENDSSRNAGYIKRYDALKETVVSYQAFLQGTLAETSIPDLLEDNVRLSTLERIDGQDSGKAFAISLAALPLAIKSVLGETAQFDLSRAIVSVTVAVPRDERGGPGRRLTFLRTLQVKQSLRQAGISEKNIIVDPAIDEINTHDKIVVIVK